MFPHSKGISKHFKVPGIASTILRNKLALISDGNLLACVIGVWSNIVCPFSQVVFDKHDVG